MSMSRQWVLVLRGTSHNLSNTRQVLYSIGATRYIAAALAQRDIKAWRSRLPSGTCIHGSKYIYPTIAWDWADLLWVVRPPKTKSKERGRWKLPRPSRGSVFFAVFLLVAMDLYDYYFPFWFTYKVVNKEEIYSTTLSIVTVRRSGSDSTWFNRDIVEFDARRRQRAWKNGIWALQISDYTKVFPRTFDYDVAVDAVYEKLSERQASVGVSQPRWTGYFVPIPKGVQQVVVFASGVTGIAPMLQTIHSLLDARRGDGIDSRTPNIHVVWFKENLKRVDENEIATLYTTSVETSTADKIATTELERLRLAHQDKLTIEPVEMGSIFEQGAKAIESAPQRSRKATFQQRLKAWGYISLPSLWTHWESFNTVNSNILIISGSGGFADSLSRYDETGSCTEDGTSILTTVEQAGWRILDLSQMKVCT